VTTPIRIAPCSGHGERPMGKKPLGPEREKRRAYHKAWQKAHRAEGRAFDKQWREENREQALPRKGAGTPKIGNRLLPGKSATTKRIKTASKKRGDSATERRRNRNEGRQGSPQKITAPKSGPFLCSLLGITGCCRGVVVIPSANGKPVSVGCRISRPRRTVAEPRAFRHSDIWCP
jgi:hypothetical protein